MSAPAGPSGPVAAHDAEAAARPAVAPDARPAAGPDAPTKPFG